MVEGTLTARLREALERSDREAVLSVLQAMVRAYSFGLGAVEAASGPELARATGRLLRLQIDLAECRALIASRGGRGSTLFPFWPQLEKEAGLPFGSVFGPWARGGPLHPCPPGTSPSRMHRAPPSSSISVSWASPTPG